MKSVCYIVIGTDATLVIIINSLVMICTTLQLTRNDVCITVVECVW